MKTGNNKIIKSWEQILNSWSQYLLLSTCLFNKHEVNVE